MSSPIVWNVVKLNCREHWTLTTVSSMKLNPQDLESGLTTLHVTSLGRKQVHKLGPAVYKVALRVAIENNVPRPGKGLGLWLTQSSTLGTKLKQNEVVVTRIASIASHLILKSRHISFLSLYSVISTITKRFFGPAECAVPDKFLNFSPLHHSVRFLHLWEV